MIYMNGLINDNYIMAIKRRIEMLELEQNFET